MVGAYRMWGCFPGIFFIGVWALVKGTGMGKAGTGQLGLGKGKGLSCTLAWGSGHGIRHDRMTKKDKKDKGQTYKYFPLSFLSFTFNNYLL